MTDQTNRPDVREPWDADAFRASLEDRGLTYAMLSRRTGLSPAFLTRLGQGQRTPSLRTLAILGRTLEVDPWAARWVA